MNDGQRKARGVQRTLSFYAVVLMIGGWWYPDKMGALAGLALIFFGLCGVIDAMRALAQEYGEKA